MSVRRFSRLLIGALYFNCFCIGVAQVTISVDLTGWAARFSTGVSELGVVMGAFGVGRLVIYSAFSLGGLRMSVRHIVAAGGLLQIAYLLLLLAAQSPAVAAAAIALAGASGAFFDVGNFPLLCSLYEKQSPSLGILTKTVMSLGQLALPAILALGALLAPGLPYAAQAGILVAGSLLGLLILSHAPTENLPQAPVAKAPFSWRCVLPFLGYSALCYASFAVVMLWMPFCLRTLAGATESVSRLSLSVFAAGSIVAGPGLAWLSGRLVRRERLLWLLPLSAAISAGAATLFPTPAVMMAASLLVGATAASGVYQLGLVLLCLRHADSRSRVTSAYLTAGAASSILLAGFTGWVAEVSPQCLLPLAVAMALLCAGQGLFCSRLCAA